MLVVGLTMIAAILFLLMRRIRNKEFLSKLSQFEGPPTFPLLGNSLMMRGSPTACFKVLHKLFEIYSTKCYVMWVFNDPYVVTGRREDVQAVSKMKHKSHVYNFLKVTLGNGLITSNGEKWKKSRVLVESVLAASELSTNSLHVFNEQSRNLIDEIKEIGMGVECNLWPLIMRVNIRFISETTIGSAKSDDLSISEGYGKGSKKGETLIMKRVYSPWLHPEIIYKLYLFFTNQSHIFENMRAPFLQAIKKRKQLAMKRKTSPEEVTQQYRKLILDALMESKYLSDENLTDEIMTLMFAGSDTSATAICFTLLMLAMNPEVQQKVHQELNTVFGEKSKAAEASDLARLTFLEQCIKETMRRYTIVPLVYRQATTDVTLSDGRVVPAGATVTLSIHEVHNNPEYYSNPQVWNPHNFDPDCVAKRPPNSFIPFTVGSRMCVGWKYAMMSMKVVLSHILRNFEVSTSQTEVKLHYNAVIKCVSGYNVRFELR